MNYIKAIIALALFLFLYAATYVTHVWYFRVEVVFYSAILDGFLAVTATGLILAFVPYFKIFTGFEKSQLIVICCLLAYSIAISVPTVIDRSLSFYILEKLEQRGGSIRLSKFDEVFIKEYLPEHRLMDVRLTEQQESGTILIDGDCVRLTQWGKNIASTSRFFRKNLLPKHRLLMGEYSDDLTDPFRNSRQDVDYSCN